MKNLLNKGLWIAAILVGLMAVSPQFSVADNRGTLPSSQIIALVEEQYIPSSTKALQDMGEAKLASLWAEASAGEPLLQWVLEGNEDEIVPLNWVCPVKHIDSIVGLIGVEPYQGDFLWRLPYVPPQYKFPFSPSENMLNRVLKKNMGAQKLQCYDRSNVRLVLIGHKNYWVVPTVNAGIDDSVCILVEDPARVNRLGQIRPDNISPTLWENRSPSLAQLEIKELPENWINQIQEIIAETGSSSQSSVADTWMKDYIPYYWQGYTSWCALFSLSMIHQWWSPVQCGTGLVQAQEIADWLDINQNQGINIFQEINVMRNWHAVNSTYESWPGSGWVNFEPIERGEPTWKTSDIKTWIALRVPVVVGVDADGTGGWSDHACVFVGYNDDDFNGRGGVYINDPAGWLGWPSNQPAVEYDTFNNRYWRFSPLVLCYEAGTVGFPGDSEPISTSVALENAPSAIYDDEIAELTLEMQVQGDNTASTASSFGECLESGIHVRTTSTDGISGNGLIEVTSTGDFNAWDGYRGRDAEKVCSSESASTGEAKIFEFYTANNAKDDELCATFTVKPDDIGDIHIYYRSWAYDEDDRIHYPNPDLRITVYDDRATPNGTLSMPKPLPYLATDPPGWSYGQNYLDYAVHSKTITVNDDDNEGPSYSNLNSTPSSPVYDSHGSYIRLEGEVSDPSDIYSVQFVIEYSDEPGMPFHYHDPSGCSGNIYWYDIPRDKWLNHLGSRIEWRIEATDNDNDRENDHSTNWSDWQIIDVVEENPSLHTHLLAVWSNSPFYGPADLDGAPICLTPCTAMASVALDTYDIDYFPIELIPAERWIALQTEVVRAVLVTEHPWVDALAGGIRFLPWNTQAIEAVKEQFPTVVTSQLPANTYPWQSMPIPGYTPIGEGPTATATRDIADETLAPGENTNVTITINNAQPQALGLDEDPPAGWLVAVVNSGGGQYNPALVEWVWLEAAAGTITVVYNLTVPLGTSEGIYDIDGTLFTSQDGVAVGGYSTITVSFFDPWDYDLDEDGVISKTEALAAVVDYFDGAITKEQALAVIVLYFAT